MLSQKQRSVGTLRIFFSAYKYYQKGIKTDKNPSGKMENHSEMLTLNVETLKNKPFTWVIVSFHMEHKL